MDEDWTRWVLTFVGDGSRAVLTTKQALHPETVEHVQEMWNRWVSSTDELMIIGGCEVRRVGQVELEIGADAIIVR